MARRILNRKELRSDFDAAERQKQDAEHDEEEKDEDEDEDEDEGDESESEEGEDEGEADVDAEEEVVKPVKKRKAAAKPKAAKPKARSRAAKIVRMKVVWGVFNNSNQRVAVFDYPKRKEAEDLAAKLKTDKKSTHFVQPVKEPIVEEPAEESKK